jgi:predicted permease
MGYTKKFLIFLKKVNRTLNNLFIAVVLIVFYFIVIGISALLYFIFRQFRKEQKNTYWNKVKKYKKEEFYSAY